MADRNNPDAFEFAGAVMLYVPQDEDHAAFWGEFLEEIGHQQGATEVEFIDEWSLANTLHSGSRFKSDRRCDHCGAVFLYGAVFTHRRGEQYVVGNICAQKLGLSTSAWADMKSREAVKRLKQKRENDARFEATMDANPGLREALDVEHYISRDLKAKARKYDLSEKQVELAFKIQRDEAAKAERDAAMVEIPEDLLEGRHTFAGEVVSTKYHDTLYGSKLKVLLLDDRGFKIYGSMPAPVGHCGRGDRIQFDAAVAASNDDPKFGFFSRPTKAQEIEA